MIIELIFLSPQLNPLFYCFGDSGGRKRNIVEYCFELVECWRVWLRLEESSSARWLLEFLNSKRGEEPYCPGWLDGEGLPMRMFQTVLSLMVVG